MKTVIGYTMWHSYSILKSIEQIGLLQYIHTMYDIKQGFEMLKWANDFNK